MVEFSNLKSLFTQRFIAPRVYMELLVSQYGPEWVEWAAETLWSEIRDDTRAKITDEVRDKINALRVFLTTDNFWQEFPSFEKIIIAFNDRYVDPEHVQVCIPEELAYGLTVAGQIREKEFSSEIVHYIRGCCEEAGLAVYPRSFRFAQPRYDDGLRQALVHRVQRAWDIERFTQMRIPPHQEHNPVLVQVGKLHDIEVYLQERLLKGEEATV